MALVNPTISILGQDPGHRRRCNINANAFQQDAVVTFQGWQYAVFYSYMCKDHHDEPLYIHLARRKLPHASKESQASAWEVVVFDDYPQTTDDGHNTVQIGICPGDGTIHLAYDHHCDVLRYRQSVPNLALTPDDFQWRPSLFSPALSHLPGLPTTHAPFKDVTYPRFGFLGSSNMFLSFRDGKAGLGNDHLYMYQAADGEAGRYAYMGQHLTGIQSNPYVNGITYTQRDNRLHITWVYRGFVHYAGWDEPLDTKHKQQAGPNGAENNHDLCYAYSEDLGYTWRNGNGEVIADLKAKNTTAGTEIKSTVTNSTSGIVAFKIPKGSGLMNQEAQAVDSEGRVHVLNRDCLACPDSDDDGSDTSNMQVKWKHYFRDPLDGKWTCHALPITPGTRRGRLAAVPTSRQDTNAPSETYIILPGSDTDSIFRILKASSKDNYTTYSQVWSSHQMGLKLAGEPLVDSSRLEFDLVLSVFCLREHGVLGQETGDEGSKGDKNLPQRDVVVLDFELPCTDTRFAVDAM
ncbi:hypothetical protein QBC37DRAFT_270991 [Rhypophila decipiens]|uniref:Uncharacterized protein n=1 Tax=Rhypophila decipiens TaxID=261697 RepID=A0AAN6YKB2_9PEZI|nr:hypothetical protein QBC37DRAFT_270991 [Rhypophila decipiens]